MLTDSDVEKMKAAYKAEFGVDMPEFGDRATTWAVAWEASKESALEEAAKAYADALFYSRREIHLALGECVIFPVFVERQLRKLEEILLPDNLGEQSYFDRPRPFQQEPK